MAFASSAHGRARWATADEISAAGVLREKPWRILFARAPKLGRMLGYSGDGNIMVTAQPGSGKGVGFVIPNLLTYPGSCLCIDPKGENAGLTAQRRREMGQDVHVIDPAGVSGQPRACFNPLAWLLDSPLDRFDADVRLIAEALVEHSGGSDTFWTMGGRDLVASLIYYLCAHEPDRLDLVRLFELSRLPEGEWRDLWSAMAGSGAKDERLRRRVRDAGNWFQGLEERHQLYHRGTVQAATAWLVSEAARESVASSSFDLRRLKDQKRPMTIYLCFGPLDEAAYKTYIRLLVGQALLSVFLSLAAREDVPVLFLLDEFANTVGRLDVLDRAYSQIRGYGGRLALILQDIDQLQSLYPEGRGVLSWRTIEGGCGAAIYFNARTHTAEHVSRRTRVTTASEASGAVGLHQMAAPLAFPEDVEFPKEYGPETLFCFVEGVRPFKAKRLTSWRDQEFAALHDPSAAPSSRREEGSERIVRASMSAMKEGRS